MGRAKAAERAGMYIQLTTGVAEADCKIAEKEAERMNPLTSLHVPGPVRRNKTNPKAPPHPLGGWTMGEEGGFPASALKELQLP